MIVCQCTGVTDSVLDQLIAEGARSLADVARRCGAGKRCPPCRLEIRDRLYSSTTALQNPSPVRANALSDRAAA